MQGIAAVWSNMDSQANRQTLLNDAELFAGWTVPTLFVEKYATARELKQQYDSLGAFLVTSMANRVFTTLYPPGQFFFGVSIRETLKRELSAQFGDEAPPLLAQIDAQQQSVVREAHDNMKRTQFRAGGTEAMEHLIVTGNALVYDPPGEPEVHVYSLRDYVVKRDMAGNVMRMITREQKSAGTLKKEVFEKLSQSSDPSGNKYTEESDVTVYTNIEFDMKLDKYVVTQAIDNMPLDGVRQTWPKELLPWSPLVWRRSRGADYGVGLVELYRGAFAALEILGNASTAGAVALADIKLFIRPGSVVDAAELNNAESGTYHYGNDGDIWALDLKKIGDMQYVEAKIQAITQVLSQAFLFTSNAIRNAERVTAEEIRLFARELESTYGKEYASFSLTWQLKTARLRLHELGFELGITQSVNITTGVDSLARNQEILNNREFIQDLSLLNTVPEPVLAEMSLQRYVLDVGRMHSIDFSKYRKTESEKATEQQAIQAQQQQLLEAQTQQQVGLQVAQSLPDQPV